MGRKVAEYESKIALLSQEIERLNSILEKKNQEIGNLQREVTELNAMGATVRQLQ